MIYFVRRPAPEPADGTAGPHRPGPHQAGPDTGGPSAGLFLTEPVRGLVDLAALLVAAPWLATAPRGDGHGVLVLPGLLASDTSTLPLRGYLGWLGYDVRGWDLGRNRGPTEEVLAACPARCSPTPGGPGARCPWWAGAWAVSTPGNWPAGTPSTSGGSSPSAAPSP